MVHLQESIVPTTGGSGTELPESTPLFVRFTHYVETGKHTTTYKGQQKTQNCTVQMGFTIVDPSITSEYKPILWVKAGKFSNEKSAYYKLFNKLSTAARLRDQAGGGDAEYLNYIASAWFLPS